MNELEIDEEMGKMWNEEKDDYVLIRRADSSIGYSIMNTVHNSFCIIEQEDIARYVVNKMLDHKVRVVDDFENVRNANKPPPIFYTPELEAQYKKLKEKHRTGDTRAK
jgi:hypothetical protein